MEALPFPEAKTPDAMTLKELQTARHNSFLLMDVVTLCQVSREATIRWDEALGLDDEDNIKVYSELKNGARADITRLGEEI